MKTKKRFLSILLSLVMVLGLMPGMSLTAYADDPYSGIKNTTTAVHFDSKDWYLIDYDSSTVTLLAKECVAASQYNSSGTFVEYSNNPTVKTAVDNYYNNSISAGAKTAVSGGGMFLLTTAQANAITNADVRKCSQYSGTDYNGWWLCSQGYDDGLAAFVHGDYGSIYGYGLGVNRTLGVRPALKLNLSSVIFSSEYNTFTLKPAHTHSFNYTASGATITATCGAEGCDLTSNPTLTIVAPTLTTYGQTGEGISEKATLDGLDAFNSATDLTVAASDIKYYGVEEYEIEGHTYKKQGDELAQVPTAAGEYVAGLTLSNVKTSETETGDVIARVWYTIAPASISSVTVTDITAPVATEALDTEAATSTANVTLGAVTWNPTTTPAAYATQYTATVIATAAANYAFADTVTATVNGQAATVTKNDGGTLTIAYTFEKTALTPVTITATDKKADWSADGIAIPVEGMFTITEGAGAATYTVTNGTGEGTYDAQTGKLTVNKADSTAATVTANTLTYTGSAQALVTVTGEATGGTMQYALGTKDAATEEYTPSIPTGTNAGT